jgi:hypothetical protein
MHGETDPLIDAGVEGYVVRLKQRDGLIPQLFCAVKQIAGRLFVALVPMKLLKFTVILAVPCPLTIDAPGGKDQLYCCTVFKGEIE